MSTPPDPWLPSRLRAQEFIRDGEQRIGRAWFRSLTRFLDRVRPAVLQGGGIDPGRVSDETGFWTDQVNVEIIPPIRSVLAESWARIRREGPGTDPWVSGYLNEAGNRLVGVPDEVYALIVRETEEGLRNNEGIPDITARVQQVLTATATPYWPNRARVVARTEVMGAVNAGVFRSAQLDAEDRGDPAPFKVWLATEDTRTRPTHVTADGQRTLLSEPFVVGGARLLFPGDPTGPAAEVVQCFPGDTQVVVPSGVVRVYRRWYEGPLIRIKTSDGVELSATPNHPLLTDSGWKAAEAFQVGDHLLGSVGGPRVGFGQPHVEHTPATFEELYRAAVNAGVARGVMGRAVDFHGDGSDSEVQVVTVHGVLRRERNTRVQQSLSNPPLVGPGHGEELLPLRSGGEDGLLSGRAGEEGALVLAGRLVGGSGESCALLRSGVGHADTHRLASSPHGQLEFLKTTEDDWTADAEVVRETLDGLPGGMALREIIEIDVVAFRGHVYNLQAVDGWYTANGTASGNCRCTMLPVVLGETIDWTDRQNP